MTILKIMLSTFLVAEAFAGGAPAFADGREPPDFTVVPTADLDLTTNSGRHSLEHRLIIAAYDACGIAADVDIAGRNSVAECRRDVLRKARSDGEQIARRAASRVERVGH